MIMFLVLLLTVSKPFNDNVLHTRHPEHNYCDMWAERGVECMCKCSRQWRAASPLETILGNLCTWWFWRSYFSAYFVNFVRGLFLGEVMVVCFVPFVQGRCNVVWKSRKNCDMKVRRIVIYTSGCSCHQCVMFLSCDLWAERVVECMCKCFCQ